MDDPEKDLESAVAELGREMDTPGGATPSDSIVPTVPANENSTQPDGSASQPSTEYEAGGRKFKTAEDVARAYDALVRDYSRKGAKLQEMEKSLAPWNELQAAWKSDPAHYNALLKASQDYQAAKKGGMSTPDAKRVSGLQGVPTEVISRLNDQEAFIEDMRLDKEIASVKSQYNVDDATLDKAMQLAIEYGEDSNIRLPLDKAVRMVRAEEMGIQAKTATEKLNRVRADANVAPSKTTPVTAQPKKPGDMSDAEADKFIDAQLRQMGLNDS